MSETDEFLPHHGDGAAGCTKGRWTVSNWKKSEKTHGSWLVSGGNWFADEKEDSGLQTVERTRSFMKIGHKVPPHGGNGKLSGGIPIMRLHHKDGVWT